MQTKLLTLKNEWIIKLDGSAYSIRIQRDLLSFLLHCIRDRGFSKWRSLLRACLTPEEIFLVVVQ